MGDNANEKPKRAPSQPEAFLDFPQIIWDPTAPDATTEHFPAFRPQSIDFTGCLTKQENQHYNTSEKDTGFSQTDAQSQPKSNFEKQMLNRLNALEEEVEELREKNDILAKILRAQYTEFDTRHSQTRGALRIIVHALLNVGRSYRGNSFLQLLTEAETILQGRGGEEG
jgi:hypothetical protein